MIPIDLSGKRALVGGATQGIGWATARRLAQAGAEVWLIARNEEKLQQRVQQLRNEGLPAGGYLVADFRLPAQVATAVQQYFQRHEQQPFHILVNNTGGPAPGPLLEATLDQLMQAFTQHVLSFHTLVKLLVPGMEAAGYGRIINIVSTSVYEPIPNLGVSNTIRAAVAGWAKTLSRELAPKSITINNILPGYTRTERLNELAQFIAQEKNIPVEKVFAQWTTTIPMGRLAEPEEIANAAVFLASPLASYITGVSLAIDGGRMHKI